MWISPCHWVRTRLPLLAGDDLVGPERRRAERHLVGCPDCRGRLASLRVAVDTLRTAAEVPAVVPESFRSLWPDLARQIRESRRPATFPWARLLTSPTFALAATLLITVGTATLWPLVSTQTTSDSLASRGPQANEQVVASSSNDQDDEPEHVLADAGHRDASARLANRHGDRHGALPCAEVRDTN